MNNLAMCFSKYQNSHPVKILYRTQGFSLVELLLAVSIMSIFLLAAISAFFGIGRGILISKMHTIANNLAQEKIEYLKDISYYRLRVTTQSDLDTYGYDNTTYTPETLTVGDNQFTRRVVIRKVSEGDDGKLEEKEPTFPDTGLKKIKVTILWAERNEKSTHTLTNLYRDPDREPTDSTISGVVKSTDGVTVLDNVKIVIEENANWEDDTAAGTGFYTINVTSGTWTVKASKTGYWDSSAQVTVAKYKGETQNFTLTAKGKGSAYGFVYLGSTDTVAVGAVVTANDELSSLTAVSTTGFWYLTDIATGTWTLVVSSGVFYQQISSVTIQVSVSTGVPNYSTNPSSGSPVTVLISTTTNGFISGKVTDGSSGLSGIYVSVGGNYYLTNTQGIYWLELSVDSYTLTINPTTPQMYNNSTYTSSTTATVSVNVGQIITVSEVALAQAGTVQGKVISSGVGDALPDIIVEIKRRNDNVQVATEITDSDGMYTFSQVPFSGNNYKVQPLLDTGESYSSSSGTNVPVSPVTVIAGSTTVVPTFTVSGAMGKISGSVREGTELIKTGVLIIATTVTISSDPPEFGYSALQGGPYYYSTVSLSDGTYELSVRGGSATYNVYAWYTKLVGTTTNTTPGTTEDSPLTVSAGGTATVDFTW